MRRSVQAPSFFEILESRLSRRDALKLVTAAGVYCWSPGSFASVPATPTAEASAKSMFGFSEIEHGVGDTHVVAPGYDAEVLIRWGDPVLADAPAFDPYRQSADAQEKQFGYNNDHIGYFPLPVDSREPGHGLLCINHEFSLAHLMFPDNFLTLDLVEIEQAAVGCSIVEVVKRGGKWRVVGDSSFARRISARSTPMAMSGPAAGSERLRTAADPTGSRVIGTMSNCGGGVTPWGTCLLAEENFNLYFDGVIEWRHRESRNHSRYLVSDMRALAGWHRFFDRWDIGKEPNEPNRFGWMVEVDPHDPSSTPRKHTALGRFFHEGAAIQINADGRVVVYMADDQAFEYVYRFVSRAKYDPSRRGSNFNLLDDGTLSVARFEEDGGLLWLPLLHGEGRINAQHGFHDQSDVLIETRVAADLAGATPMDRPEGIAVSPVSQHIFVTLTGNELRTPDRIDRANSRPMNMWGQLLELMPPGGDHTADEFRWEILVQCGPPGEATAATWNPQTSAHGWFAGPDNCAVDGRGGLWVCTDQNHKWRQTSGTLDGLWAVETEGELRATGRMFFRAPIGAELTGPAFTPDDRSLFLSVQHPAFDWTERNLRYGQLSTFHNPVTRWPDFSSDMPPRPAVLAVTKENGGVVGTG